MSVEQIIWTGNYYELVYDTDRAEIPKWPVMDAGAHWHYRKFKGQRVCFRDSNVHFGFLAELVGSIADFSEDTLFQDKMYVVGSQVFRAK